MMKKTKFKFHPVECLMRLGALAGIVAILFIFAFVFIKAWPVISHNGLGLLINRGFDKQISEAFYAPVSDPMLTFGMAGLIAGTLVTTLIALIFSGIISIGSAITICEFAPRPLASALIAVVRLMASIPSVVFGLIGAMLVVPFVDQFITLDIEKVVSEFYLTGRNLLSASIVLTFMIAPTVITLSVDALYSVPDIYRETGYAFGMTRFRVISRILLPSARPGIVAGFILGAGRGIGEAIAVSMVCGGLGMIPDLKYGFISLLTPVLPLSAAIINKSEAMSVPAVESALFACGALLLVLGTVFSLVARFLVKRFSSGGLVNET
ncbi:MAG: phosphate ABC transporter permease subunit PstC [Syntrophomonadaceae bacterium]|jgi:phosphate transport system permease protein|nr:phosphate ABC transporter permease subunit PstC [Syntrophomonadaceae bacterium]